MYFLVQKRMHTYMHTYILRLTANPNNPIPILILIPDIYGLVKFFFFFFFLRGR